MAGNRNGAFIAGRIRDGWSNSSSEESNGKQLDAADAAEIEAADALCHQVIRANARRSGWEAILDVTPVHELIGKESGNPALSDKMRARQETLHALLSWIFGDPFGPHPAAAMRRLYLVAYQLDPGLIAHMPMADIGLMTGEKKQHWSWRLKKLFAGKLRSRSQKRSGASPVYAAAARGNNSRRKGERRNRRARRNGRMAT